MRKTHLIAGLFAVAGALVLNGKASADLITNGDFSAGNTGFTSGYTEDSSAGAGENAGANQGAGYYGIVTDSTFWHPLFADFHDHTGDSAGLMMIVNGDNTPNTTVWQEGGIDLTPGVTYELTFWAASAYTVSPANLEITASDGATDQTIALGGDAGVWHQFTMDFVANSNPTTISLTDNNTDLSGNDFALDDISLTPVRSNGPVVPLPASAFSGSILLAGVALANKIRHRRLV